MLQKSFMAQEKTNKPSTIDSPKNHSITNSIYSTIKLKVMKYLVKSIEGKKEKK